MAEIVTLLVFVNVVEDDDGGHKVHHLSRGQQVLIRTSVAPSVSVTEKSVVSRIHNVSDDNNRAEGVANYSTSNKKKSSIHPSATAETRQKQIGQLAMRIKLKGDRLCEVPPSIKCDATRAVVQHYIIHCI